MGGNKNDYGDGDGGGDDGECWERKEGCGYWGGGGEGGGGVEGGEGFEGEGGDGGGEEGGDWEVVEVVE